VNHNGNPAQVAFDECHLGTVHRDIGSGAHGHADVSLRERRCVINAIARDRNDAAFMLELLHQCELVGRFHFTVHLVDAELGGDRLRRRQPISRRHDDVHARGLELRQRLGGRGLDRV